MTTALLYLQEVEIEELEKIALFDGSVGTIVISYWKITTPVLGLVIFEKHHRSDP